MAETHYSIISESALEVTGPGYWELVTYLSKARKICFLRCLVIIDGRLTHVVGRLTPSGPSRLNWLVCA